MAEIRGDLGGVRDYEEAFKAVQKLAELRTINPQLGEVIESVRGSDQPKVVKWEYPHRFELTDRDVVLGNPGYFKDCLPYGIKSGTVGYRYLTELGFRFPKGKIIEQRSVEKRSWEWTSGVSVDLGGENVCLSSWVYCKWLYDSGCLSNDNRQVLAGLMAASSDLAPKIRKRGLMVMQEFTDNRNHEDPPELFLNAVALPREAILQTIDDSRYFRESFPEDQLFTVYAAGSGHHNNLISLGGCTDDILYHERNVSEMVIRFSPVAVIFRFEPALNGRLPQQNPQILPNR